MEENESMNQCLLLSSRSETEALQKRFRFHQACTWEVNVTGEGGEERRRERSRKLWAHSVSTPQTPTHTLQGLQRLQFITYSKIRKRNEQDNTSSVEQKGCRLLWPYLTKKVFQKSKKPLFSFSGEYSKIKEHHCPLLCFRGKSQFLLYNLI